MLPALVGVMALATVTALGWIARGIVADEKPRAADGAGSAADAPDRSGLSVAGNPSVEEHIRYFKGRGAVGDPSSKPLSPEESLRAFTIPDDLEIELVLHEPIVRQPVAITFDQRGRMWVMQYIQYPFPAGLKVVKYDEHLRAVFDKVPPPPPHHFPGADKITIHEDTDGDGLYDRHKTFVDGLSIATSCAIGRGGVWVLNPPYLLFYPDRDGDDVPDGDPEVHLSGFGLEDTHAVANSLHWGPDGWLYGAQGSTCWATISSAVSRNVHFKGQAIWRYHPETKVFEIFAEGGGNTFCLEFDSKGRAFSGHNGGNTRGFHFVQGGYYRKNWGKHGPLTNPHAYGFFTEMAHHSVERFSHTLVVYEGGALPERFEGNIVAPVPLHHYVALAQRQPEGSTFATRDVEKTVTTSDKWFRPVDIKAGPDGAIYLVDWYDTRLTHVDPRDTWDRTHGRIYRLKRRGAAPLAPFDLGRLSSAELLAYLEHPNKWFRQTALRLLGDRQDASILPRLRDLVARSQGQLALEALWALYQSGGFDDEVALLALDHADPYVRLWAVRLLGDQRQVSPAVAQRLAALARTEPHVEVRSQLACSARRLDGGVALPIVDQLLRRDEDISDPHLPLLLWWAVESKVSTDRDAVLSRFATPQAWQMPLVRQYVLPRLAQRFAAELTPADQQALIALLRAAPQAGDRRALLEGINRAFEGRRIGPIAPELARVLRESQGQVDLSNPAQVALAVRAGDPTAHDFILKFVADDDARFTRQRVEYLTLLGQVGRGECVPVLLNIVRTSRVFEVRRAALLALQRFDDEQIGRQLVAMYASLPQQAEVRTTAIDVLSTRAAWGLALLHAVQRGDIAREDVPQEIIERLKLHRQAEIDDLLARLWGRTRATPAEKLQQIERIARLLQDGSPADPAAGRALFDKTCAKCHVLFGEGKKVGPDLTGYERGNLDFLLLAVVDPSAAIREEFTIYQVVTVDGLILTGFLRQVAEKTITIESADKGPIVIPKEDIDAGPIAMAVSMMPDKLLDDYTDQQLRDLFAYLRSQPTASSSGR
jgi:putative membrane-bound dehydrogenase-like protein